jgi:3-phenylpropionate/trans-cinnamate dioxygenase ferredoxin subunit
VGGVHADQRRPARRRRGGRRPRRGLLRPQRAAGDRGLPLSRLLDVCAVEELPAGTGRVVRDGPLDVGVYNLDGELYALEDRCSHDDGPLCEGELDADAGACVCPRHGARIDIRTGRALTLPAVTSVSTYPVRVEAGRVVVELEA